MTAKTIHPLRLAFEKAINTTPNDSAARGIYADWLEEQTKLTPADAALARLQRRLAELSWNACLSGFMEVFQTRRGKGAFTYSWDDKAPRGFIRVTRSYDPNRGIRGTTHAIFYVRKLDGRIYRPEGYAGVRPRKRPLKHGLNVYCGRK